MKSSKFLETYFYLFCGIIMGGGFSILGPSLPYLAEKTNRALDEVSDLFLIMPLGFVFGIFVFRNLASKDWLRGLLLFGILVHIIFLPLIPPTESFLLVALMLFIISVGRGFVNLSGNVLLLELHKTKPGPYLSAFHFCFGLGATLTPVAVGFNLEYNGGIFLSYLVFALLNIPLLLFILRFKTSVVPPHQPSTMPRKSLLKVLALIYLFLFCYVTVEAGYGTWIFSYMSEKEGGIISVAHAGIFTSAYWLCFTLGRLAVIFLSGYFHPIKLIVSHSVLAVVSLIVLIIFPQDIWIAWPANIGVGWGVSVMFPCMIYYSKSAFNIPAKTIGNYFLAALAGAMAGPWFLGQVFVLDRELIFYPMVIACAALPLSALLIYRMDKTRTS